MVMKFSAFYNIFDSRPTATSVQYHVVKLYFIHRETVLSLLAYFYIHFREWAELPSVS